MPFPIYSRIFRTLTCFVTVLLPVAGLCQLTYYHETPANGSVQSGVGIIRGWACDADEISITINDGPQVPVAYGTSRADTSGVCGDDDNGYGMVMAWGLLGSGLHRLQTFVDGNEISDVEFEVAALGSGFERGLEGIFVLDGFPSPAEAVRVGWSQADQNYIITGIDSGDGFGTVGENFNHESTTGRIPGASEAVGGAYHETPAQHSVQSGVGLIRGWACDADEVTVTIDDSEQIPIGYGTDRADTIGVCGDRDNGYGMVMAWGLLGSGVHEMQTFVNGTAISHVEFEVVAVGSGFERGLSGEYALEGFPNSDSAVAISWSEPDQNFRISNVDGVQYQWVTAADMPTERLGLTMVQTGDKLYAVGGHTGQGAAGLNALQMFDPASGQWSERTPMNTPRIWATAAVVEGKIYAIGGYQNSSTRQGDQSAEEYDPNTDTWRNIADMPTQRWGPRSAVMDGKIYVAGGRSHFDLVDAFEVYDPADDHWEMLAPLPEARVPAAMAAAGGRVFVFGGGINSGASTTVWVYDPDSGNWSTYDPMPTARANGCAVVMGTNIYVLGGHGDSAFELNREVNVFNTVSNTWSTISDIPTSRWGLACETYGGRIYAAGGAMEVGGAFYRGTQTLEIMGLSVP